MTMQNPLKCRNCTENNPFLTPLNYELHMRDAHDGDPVFMCDICEYNTSTYWNFVAHLHEAHTGVSFKTLSAHWRTMDENLKNMASG
jgi:hypothetical protein